MEEPWKRLDFWPSLHDSNYSEGKYRAALLRKLAEMPRDQMDALLAEHRTRR